MLSWSDYVNKIAGTWAVSYAMGYCMVIIRFTKQGSGAGIGFIG